MTEHKELLWRVETTSNDKTVFHLLACCLSHAAEKAEDYIGEEDTVISITLEAPLVVEGDDDDDPDELERPLTAKEQESIEGPRAKPNTN